MLWHAIALANFLASFFSCTEAVCRNTQFFLVHLLPSSMLKQSLTLLVLFSDVEEEVALADAAFASVFALAIVLLALRSALLLDVEEELAAED